MKFELPQLPYAYDALEPYIDAKTMELHHSKHHQTYVTKLNEAFEKHPELQNKALEEILISLSSVPQDIQNAVKNHGGGHMNHSIFWKMMNPPTDGNGEREPKEEMQKIISKQFGDFKKFKEEFSKAAAGVFGSGWAWFVKNAEGKYMITTTPNQDSPIMRGEMPILGLDVWEHAYYLKYQNKRPDYIDAWWHVVNWTQVEENLKNPQ